VIVSELPKGSDLGFELERAKGIEPS
jgi:hypothetical protein